MVAIADFAHKFGLVLKACNLSRGRLAQAVGIDKSVVSRWASGVQAPTDHNLTLLTEAIGHHVPGFARVDWELASEAFAARVGLGEGSSADEPALPDRPSIAVLPFTNMSGDADQEYFADGMVDEIITGLSRNKGLFVIARNSSFAYKGKSPDIRQVGRRLGVRYVLEGSVRKSGNRVRITAQLIEALAGSYIWTDRFDGNLEDIFDLQDQIASRVVGGIGPSVESAEWERARRKSGSLEAYDCYLRAMAVASRFTVNAFSEGLALMRQAVALDPDFALGNAMIAYFCLARLAWGWSLGKADDRTKVDAEDREEAVRAARRALTLDVMDPRVLTYSGHTLVVLDRLEEGAAHLDRAVAFDPNFALAWSLRGYAKVALGEPKQAIVDLERALRLSPLDPMRFFTLNIVASAHFACGRIDRAASFAAESLRLRPNYPNALVTLAAAYRGAVREKIEDLLRLAGLPECVQCCSRIVLAAD